MLFWTDNINEPRKINIQRSILGSFGGSAIQTILLSNGVITNNDVKERLVDELLDYHINNSNKASFKDICSIVNKHINLTH